MESKAKRGSRWETWAITYVKLLTPARSNFCKRKVLYWGIPIRGNVGEHLGSINTSFLCICLFGESALSHNHSANQAKLPLGSRTCPWRGAQGQDWACAGQPGEELWHFSFNFYMGERQQGCSEGLKTTQSSKWLILQFFYSLLPLFFLQIFLM